MISISSADIEAFDDQLRKLDSTLNKLGNSQVIEQSTIDEIAASARKWIQYSQHLLGQGIVDSSQLEKYDMAGAELLNATKSKTRATSYRRKLAPFLKRFYDEIVIPTIKHEGSLQQVAARQIQTTLAPHLDTEELSYIEEAVKCASMQCYRATIILLWAAAMARFHRAVERAGYDKINQSIASLQKKSGHPYNKLQNAKIGSLADLQRMRDYDLLVVGIDLWSYDLQVFQELERLLGTRNTAAHPGTFTPGGLDVQQFTTKLDDYVFNFVPGPSPPLTRSPEAKHAYCLLGTSRYTTPTIAHDGSPLRRVQPPCP